MPVLDTRIWVGREQRETGVPEGALNDTSLITTKPGALKRVVLYSFYRKPMAHPVQNMKSSVHPESVKVPTAVSEITRRIKNTSRDLPGVIIE